MPNSNMHNGVMMKAISTRLVPASPLQRFVDSARRPSTLTRLLGSSRLEGLATLDIGPKTQAAHSLIGPFSGSQIGLVTRSLQGIGDVDNHGINHQFLERRRQRQRPVRALGGRARQVRTLSYAQRIVE